LGVLIQGVGEIKIDKMNDIHITRFSVLHKRSVDPLDGANPFAKRIMAQSQEAFHDARATSGPGKIVPKSLAECGLVAQMNAIRKQTISVERRDASIH